MATWTKFNCFTEDLAEKVHNLGSDTLKIMLTNTAPNAANTIKSDITEISAGNGYTAGGSQAAQSSSAQTSGTYKLVLGDVTFTASGGSIPSFRYFVLYNDTATSDNLIAYADYGSSVGIASGDSFTIDNSAANGVLQIS